MEAVLRDLNCTSENSVMIFFSTFLFSSFSFLFSLSLSFPFFCSSPTLSLISENSVGLFSFDFFLPFLQGFVLISPSLCLLFLYLLYLSAFLSISFVSPSASFFLSFILSLSLVEDKALPICFLLVYLLYCILFYFFID